MNKEQCDNFIPELGLTVREMVHGINYSRHIQDAILCNRGDVRNIFGEFCIVYEPKNVISGDFYYCHEQEDLKYLAVCDCTGHNFSGALLTILGHNILQCAMIKYQKLDDIFSFLNTNIVESFTSEVGIVGQGMDLGMIRLDKKDNTLYFLGAKRPIYLLSDGEISVIKSNRNSIGYSKVNDWKEFEIKVKKGDKLFLFSDGFTDQFNHDNEVKFGAKKLRELLVKHSSCSIQELQDILQNEFNLHRKDQVLTDDVLLMGIEI